MALEQYLNINIIADFAKLSGIDALHKIVTRFYSRQMLRLPLTSSINQESSFEPAPANCPVRILFVKLMRVAIHYL